MTQATGNVTEERPTATSLHLLPVSEVMRGTKQAFLPGAIAHDPITEDMLPQSSAKQRYFSRVLWRKTLA